MQKLIMSICAVFLMAGICSAAVSSASMLSNIEKQIFGYEYTSEADAVRITRIEKQLYGKTSPNPTLTRISKVYSDLGLTDNNPQSVAQNTNNNSNTTKKSVKTQPQMLAKESPEVEYPIVNEIEESVFGKNYNGENIYSRLDRIENKVYQKTSDADLNTRVNKLRISVLDDIAKSKLSKKDPEFEEFKDTYDQYDAVAQPPSLYDDNAGYNYSSPKTSNKSYQDTELSAVEKVVLNRTYPNEDVDARLSRLEIKIFKRNFQTESSSTRLDRISAAATAKQTSKMYDNNKLMKNLATGMQVGGFLLMILAMIL